MLKCSGLGRLLPVLSSSGGPKKAIVAAVYTLKNTVGTPNFAPISGIQYGAKSKSIKSGTLFRMRFSNGKPSTCGNGIPTRFILDCNFDGIGGNRCRFFGVETYEIKIPFAANFFDNSRVEDICIEGLKTCYFLDFIGPKGFASELFQRTSSKIIGFDHRQSVLSKISSTEYFDVNLTFHVNIEKSSSTAAYEYFSAALMETRSDNDYIMPLLNPEEREQMEIMLKYIEDEDLRKRRLPDIQAFKIGLRNWHSKLNCITNPWMYQQLMEISAAELIKKGNTYLFCRKSDADKLLHKVFRVRLGRGAYGECLGFRADGNSELSDEIGKELSKRSVAAGLRPIGAVIYMQRNNLKMCLRTTDSSTDTSEIAKAYGGGGLPSSSSFIIRMDEYNEWLSPQ